MSAAGFLPQGVAVAATPGTIDTVTCAQISAELRNGSLNCSPIRHDGVDGVFIGPVSPGTSPAGGTTSGSATTSGGTGSTSTTTPTTSTPTTEPTTEPTQPTTEPSSGGSDGSDDDSDDSAGGDSGGASDDDSDDSGSSGSGSSGSGSSDDSDDDSGSSSSSSGSSGSSSGGSSYSTNSGVTLGAAACPAGVGGTTATTATGSVDTSATTSTTTTTAPETDVSGVASVTDVTGGLGTGLGTVTNNVAATAGTVLSPVAGTVATAGAAVASNTSTGSASTGSAAAGSANLPADVIDLSYWYLTLPTGAEGSPDTVENPNLTKFTNEYFKLNNSRDGVVFSARADGVTTKNSSYPRSELREMNGSEKAAWSNTTGSHTLDVCEAITKTPSSKPEVVAAQIHDGSDDVMQIRLEGKTLMVQYNDGQTEIVIDPNYQLGTPYNVRIVAEGSKVDVLYNGQKKAELPLSGSGWYWKVGAYVQSSIDKGESPDATGEVTVYSLKCVHS